MVQSPFIDDVYAELRSSEVKHGSFKSLHEAYAVLLEEVDELWDEVRKRSPDKQDLRSELVQIAAMAWKTAQFLNVEQSS